jgi:hypothetical protein
VSLILIGMVAWLAVGALVGVPIGRMIKAANPIDEDPIVLPASQAPARAVARTGTVSARA